MMSMILQAPTLLTAMLLALFVQPGPQAPSTSAVDLLIRVFDGADEVTSLCYVAVYRAASRDAPVASGTARLNDDAVVFPLPPGFYDVQAVLERDGRVEKLRWAERLTVQRYPDEGGRHLEVMNFAPYHGALQVRRAGEPTQGPVAWEAFAFRPGDHATVLGTASPGDGYRLLSLEAGTYDVAIRAAGELTWYTEVDVPRGRTAVLRID